MQRGRTGRSTRTHNFKLPLRGVCCVPVASNVRPHKACTSMSALLSEIQALETELHHPGVRCSVARLHQLLHKDFHEVGRSGRAYDLPTIIGFLSEQKASPSVVADWFTLDQLGHDIALLTYRSAHQRPDGALENHTLRSSVWVRSGGLWQLRYHQGTPAAVPWQ